MNGCKWMKRTNLWLGTVNIWSKSKKKGLIFASIQLQHWVVDSRYFFLLMWSSTCVIHFLTAIQALIEERKEQPFDFSFILKLCLFARVFLHSVTVCDSKSRQQHLVYDVTSICHWPEVFYSFINKLLVFSLVDITQWWKFQAAAASC